MSGALAVAAYLQLDSTVIVYNRGAARLQGLLRSWAAGSAGAADEPARFDLLVEQVETAIGAERGGWVQQMNSALDQARARTADRDRAAG